MEFKQGDLVCRKSYNSDILFKIKKVTETHALLKGLDFRLLADAPLEDLVVPSIDKINEHKEKTQEKLNCTLTLSLTQWYNTILI